MRARDGIPDWDELQQLLAEWQPELVVVGLPLNMDDSPSELSRLAEKFGRRLEGRFLVSVEFIDERLSSYEAKQQMRDAGHKGDFKKQPADGIAAQLILETYLAS